MLKTFFKKTLLFLIVAIMALTPAITFTAPVYAGTTDAYDAVRDWIKAGSGIEAGLYGTNSYRYVINYDDKRDALSFEFFEWDYYNGSNREARNMTLKVETNPYMRDKADITIEYKDDKKILIATTKCNLTTLKASKNIEFTIKDGEGKDYSSKSKLQKYLRVIFDRGVASWDSVICDKTGYRLNDIGMNKYKLNTKKIIHHDGEYHCCNCGYTAGSEADINAHCDQDINCAFAGWTGRPGWDEYDTSWDEILSSLAKAVRILK